MNKLEITGEQGRLTVTDGSKIHFQRNRVPMSKFCMEAEAAFADFEGIWRAMTPWERRRVARLLIERVDYDDEAESIEVTFRPDSIRAFADRALEEAA